MVHRGAQRRQGYNIFLKPECQFWHRKVDTENKMQERSTSSGKGRMKESMKRFVGKPDICVIAEPFREWTEAGINGSAVRNDRKGEGRRWEGLKPNKFDARMRLWERAGDSDRFGLWYLPKPFGWKRTSFSLSGLEEIMLEIMLELLRCLVPDAWEGKNCTNTVQKIHSGCAFYSSVLT